MSSFYGVSLPGCSPSCSSVSCLHHLHYKKHPSTFTYIFVWVHSATCTPTVWSILLPSTVPIHRQLLPGQLWLTSSWLGLLQDVADREVLSLFGGICKSKFLLQSLRTSHEVGWKELPDQWLVWWWWVFWIQKLPSFPSPDASATVWRSCHYTSE